jgi:hypothetical protein
MADQMVASKDVEMVVMMVYEWVSMWAELMVWQLVH